MPPTTRKAPQDHQKKAPTKRASRAKAQAQPGPRVEQPAAEAESDSRYGRGWQKGSDTGMADVTLPSGAIALVRNPGMAGLIEAGVLEKLDPLTAMVDQKLVQPASRGQGAGRKSGKVSRDEALAMMEIADRIAPFVIVEPKVALAPTPMCTVCYFEDNDTTKHRPEDGHDFAPKPRDPNVYYTDGIELDDKLATLQYALGGARALESFRDERAAVLDSLASG